MIFYSKTRKVDPTSDVFFVAMIKLIQLLCSTYQNKISVDERLTGTVFILAKIKNVNQNHVTKSHTL